MRVRLVLGIALAVALVVFLLVVSQRSQRIAGTDHINPVGFIATVPSHGMLCQPEMVLPSQAGSVQTLIGTYGRPVPALSVAFKDMAGQTIASGSLAAGARQGNVRVPLSYPHGSTTSGELCIHFGQAEQRVVVAGDLTTPGPASERIDGRPVEGRIAVTYYWDKAHSWWRVLGSLDESIGLGKGTVFGDWTFPVLAALMAGMWLVVARLLLRELR